MLTKKSLEKIGQKPCGSGVGRAAFHLLRCKVNEQENIFTFSLTLFGVNQIFDQTTITEKFSNHSGDEKFAILMFTNGVHWGLLVLSCTKYRVAQAPYATQGIQDAFFLYTSPVENTS